MTYSKAGIIFRSRKTKTYCGSDKIKKQQQIKTFIKGDDGYPPNRSKETHPLNTKK